MRVMSKEQSGFGAPSLRFEIVDIVRGAAILGVVIYHFAWDLSFLRFISTDVATHPLWSSFARSLAGTFMVLVGVSLTLGHEKGIRWRPFFRRLAVIAASAFGITVATYLLFPASFIYFGILHSITMASVLALPFLVAPLWLATAAGLFVLTLPALVRSPVFNDRTLAWIGFASQPPPANDYEPLFPWFGLTLIGIVAARLVLKPPLRDRFAAVAICGQISRTLAWAGRRSLLIYLLHQPVLLALLYTAVLLS
jgi:uncharacterized membrane protein